MKNYFLNLLGVLLPVLIGSIAPIHAQNDKKLNVYVKNFTYGDDAGLEIISDNLTSEFETELVKLGIYNVLERARLDRLMKAIETEKKIADIQELKTTAKDSLKAYKAEAIFFGHIAYYRDDGRCKVTITLQDIYQGNTIKKDYMMIVLGDIKNPKTRGDFVKALLKKLYAKEIVAIKKGQMNTIEEKLSSYRARVKEVIDVYEEKIDYLLDLSGNEIKPHIEEIEQKREAFNSIWNDLNTNRRKYINTFDMYWGQESRTALKYIYSETMDDFHPGFKSYLNYLQTRINTHRKQEFRNKRKRKEAKDELVKDIKRELLKKLDEDYYTDVDKKINTFLDSLSEEITKESKQHN